MWISSDSVVGLSLKHNQRKKPREQEKQTQFFSQTDPPVNHVSVHFKPADGNLQVLGLETHVVRRASPSSQL